MTYSSTVAALSVLVAACAAQSVDLQQTQITGEWGGDKIQVTDSAAAHAIVLSTFCSGFMYPSPTLDSTGFFDMHGIVIRSTDVWLIGDSTHAFGTVRGNTMDVYLSLTMNEGKGTPTHYELTRNRPPNRTGLICLD